MADRCGPTLGSDDVPATPTFDAEQNLVDRTDPNAPDLSPGGPVFEDPPGEEATPEEAFWEAREFEADFDTATATLVGVSVTKRPDAVSFDYLTSFSLGPVAIADVSEGARARAWKAEAINGEVYLSRESDTGDSWDSPVRLFGYSGVAVEIDLAFEQAGRAVVALEIADHLWLYWYDPTILPSGSFVLQDFGVGRNPRTLLDDPFDTSNSDVLVFYIAGDEIVYRQQRDRYATEIGTGTTGLTNKFLEDAVRTTDRRVGILISVRNTSTGRYSFARLDSVLYPITLDADNFQLAQLIQSGVLEVIVINHTLFDIDSFQFSQLIQSGTLYSPLIVNTLYDIDQFQFAQLIQSGELAVVVIVHTLYDIDSFQLAQLIQSGTLVAIVLAHTLYDVESFQFAQQIQSGILEVA